MRVSKCRPCARRDGPRLVWNMWTNRSSAPRTQGWSWIGIHEKCLASVGPTNAGMGLPTRLAHRLHKRRPHTRGDGPLEEKAYYACDVSAPRTRGMVPPGRLLRGSRGRRPHARGDGPISGVAASRRILSARALGDDPAITRPSSDRMASASRRGDRPSCIREQRPSSKSAPVSALRIPGHRRTLVGPALWGWLRRQRGFRIERHRPVSRTRPYHQGVEQEHQ